MQTVGQLKQEMGYTKSPNICGRCKHLLMLMNNGYNRSCFCTYMKNRKPFKVNKTGVCLQFKVGEPKREEEKCK